jgi:hypothetical protein
VIIIVVTTFIHTAAELPHQYRLIVWTQLAWVASRGDMSFRLVLPRSRMIPGGECMKAAIPCHFYRQLLEFLGMGHKPR